MFNKAEISDELSNQPGRECSHFWTLKTAAHDWKCLPFSNWETRNVINAFERFKCAAINICCSWFLRILLSAVSEMRFSLQVGHCFLICFTKKPNEAAQLRWSSRFFFITCLILLWHNTIETMWDSWALTKVEISFILLETQYWNSCETMKNVIYFLLLFSMKTHVLYGRGV